MTVAPEVDRYLEQLVGRLHAALADRLVGVYLIGGAAFGEYRPGSSDLDVYAVVSDPLADEQKLAVARDCSHRMLPCPARVLELVVISVAALHETSAMPRWELNLNTGAGQPEHVGMDPAQEPSHWFVIDLAIAHERGIALLGPPARELIPAPTAAAVRAAQAETVAWFAQRGEFEASVIAGCRAWHWQDTGRFAGKAQAQAWPRTATVKRPAEPLVRKDDPVP